MDKPMTPRLDPAREAQIRRWLAQPVIEPWPDEFVRELMAELDHLRADVARAATDWDTQREANEELTRELARTTTALATMRAAAHGMHLVHAFMCEQFRQKAEREGALNGWACSCGRVEFERALRDALAQTEDK